MDTFVKLELYAHKIFCRCCMCESKFISYLHPVVIQNLGYNSFNGFIQESDFFSRHQFHRRQKYKAWNLVARPCLNSMAGGGRWMILISLKSAPQNFERVIILARSK